MAIRAGGRVHVVHHRRHSHRLWKTKMVQSQANCVSLPISCSAQTRRQPPSLEYSRLTKFTKSDLSIAIIFYIYTHSEGDAFIDSRVSFLRLLSANSKCKVLPSSNVYFTLRYRWRKIANSTAMIKCDDSLRPFYSGPASVCETSPSPPLVAKFFFCTFSVHCQFVFCNSSSSNPRQLSATILGLCLLQAHNTHT